MNNTAELWQEAQNHLARCDVQMAELIASYGPCSLSPRNDYFLQLCRSIVSQQLATKAADAIFGRFAAFYGHAPTPALVAATSGEELRRLGLSNQKVSYIRDLAERALTDRLRLGDFSGLPDEAIVAQLVAVKGIGVWTAQMFLIFALGRPDVLPTDDLGVRKAMMLRCRLEALPSKMEMEALAQPWRPWRSVASWYLWRSLNN